MARMNVESFNLDHRKVVAPYVRIADVKHLPHGDTLTKYDVRFTQPNQAHLDMAAVHSIEHSFAEHARNHSDAVVDFSPIGCQTGFYLILAEEPNPESTMELVEQTFRDILAETEVPAANEIQCGWGAPHSLEGAQAAVREMLAHRAEWAQVMRDDAEVGSSTGHVSMKARGNVEGDTAVGTRQATNNGEATPSNASPDTNGSEE